ncbi:hypothetical protein C8Q75DRAFT_764149 [Abortiporus biennis]|nr:hypothetical protein C8Q75DRAFT_764149 [Abortiporus biennis]
MSPPQVVNIAMLPGLQLHSALGALFIGLIVTTSLTGIGFLQTFIYLMKSARKDHVLIQASVSVGGDDQR